MLVGIGKSITDKAAVKQGKKKLKTSAGAEEEGEEMPTPLFSKRDADDGDMEAEIETKATEVSAPSSSKKKNQRQDQVSPDSKTPGSGSQTPHGAKRKVTLGKNKDSKDDVHGVAGGKKGRKKADLFEILQKGVTELGTAEQSSSKFFGSEWKNVMRNWNNYLIDLNTRIEEEADATTLELYQVAEKQAKSARKVLQKILLGGFTDKLTVRVFQEEIVWLGKDPCAPSPFPRFLMEMMHAEILSLTGSVEEFWQKVCESEMEAFIKPDDIAKRQVIVVRDCMLVMTLKPDLQTVAKEMEAFARAYVSAAVEGGGFKNELQMGMEHVCVPRLFRLTNCSPTKFFEKGSYSLVQRTASHFP